MKFQKNVLLKNYTTFKIGGPADYFFVSENKTDLLQAIRLAKKKNLPFFILGGGSNLLISDRGYKGLVIKIKNQKMKAVNENISAEAGVTLNKLVSLSLNNNLTGLEWAAGIPGTVGGAVRGNAGAFGESMQNVVENVEVFDVKNNKFKKLRKTDCQFSYRNSVFKENPNLVILSCEFLLKLERKKKIQGKIEKNLSYRKLHHPKQPSAGSIFKNVSQRTLKKDFFKRFPEAQKVIKENVLPTAFLIDMCGLRGKRIGGAQISETHPNFIINTGKATSKDVLSLIRFVKTKIKQKTGIEIKEEIKKLN
ncbi:MAG: UDP-N-acetylmuramate dehydrogenase [Candidatus Nealsonbacteria bacterium]|nr:UDP-N-acetylmuramate dehydrogenase [Candidatus Nealsonbacteria bacterium]